MLFSASVLKWKTLNGDTDRRVRVSTGTTFLLNTNRLDGIRAMANAANSSLYYFDNPFDSKCNSDYMEVALSVAQLKTQADTAPTHTFMRMPVYPNMDSTKTPADITIPIGNFAYGVAVADSGSATDSLVYYVTGNKLTRARVQMTLTQLLAVVA